VYSLYKSVVNYRRQQSQRLCSTNTYQPVEKVDVNQGKMKLPAPVNMEETWNNFYPVAHDCDTLKFVPRVRHHITGSVSGYLWLKINHIFHEKNSMQRWDNGNDKRDSIVGGIP
jgi:hypothetical protein